MASNLITKAEFKAYAGINSTNYDAEIDSLIPKVSQFIRTYCKRTFNEFVDDPKVEHFDGGVGFFILSETPIINVASVEYSTDFGQTHSSLVKYVDWYPDDYMIVSVNPGGWAKQPRGYKVSYTCGYETLPEDLKLAALDLVKYYRQNDSAVHSPKAPGTNSVQIEYMANVGLPSHIKRVLNLYCEDYR